MRLTHASVFSGIGGPEIAATMLGWDNAFHCEINEFGRKILEYWYPNSKSYEDITKTDFSEWRGRVDVLTGGFPCQPFSYAGQRRGAEDDRYLWPHMFRCIDQVRPTWVVAENVAGILTMVEQGEVSPMESQGTLFDEGDGVRRHRLVETFTLQRICDDLEGHGYEVQPVLVPACAVGAPHRRDRVFIVARRVEAVSEDTMHGGQLHGQDEVEGSERNIGNVGAGGSERLRGEVSRSDSTDSRSGGQSAPEQQGERERTQVQQQGREQSFDGIGIPSASRPIADTSCECGKRLRPRQSEVGRAQQEQSGGRGCESDSERIHTDTHGALLQCGNGEGTSDCESGYRIESLDSKAGLGRWDSFPTVSPIHRGNDGLPFPLDDLAIPASKWRTESIKAYGNAIVPQVMYEIFRAIEIVERENL